MNMDKNAMRKEKEYKCKRVKEQKSRGEKENVSECNMIKKIDVRKQHA